MKSNRGFWDSSSLIPLCFEQKEFSPVARAFLREFPGIVVWWNSRLEIENGFQRLLRWKEMNEEVLEAAIHRLSMISQHWREIMPTEEVRGTALQIIKRHSLSTADALQLAAALVWCNQRPGRRPFVCFDRDLREAARRVGFQVYSYP